MNSTDKKKRFKKADSFLSMILIFWLILMPISKLNRLDPSLVFTVYFALASVISGYVSFLYSRLPKSEREKANWSSYCGLDIHPYITFILLVIATLIGARGVWIKFST